MRVLQVHTRYREAGGEDTVVASDAVLLRAAGHEVALHEAVNPAGARAGALLTTAPFNPAAAAAVRRAVDLHRPDLAHVHNTWFAMSPSVPVALARRAVPVVATLHNYRRVCVNASLYRDGGACHDCVGRSPWPGVLHRCYRSSALSSTAVALTTVLDRVLRLSDAAVSRFLVLNRWMFDVLVAGGLDPAKVTVRGNPVADPGPRPAPPSASGYVVVLGRVTALKGVDVLVEAWRLARPPDLQLVVVGDGPQRPELEARTVLGVRFVGAVPSEQVRALLLGARALVLPSVWAEGQPMSVLEAMSAGLAVLSSDVGGMPELLSDLPPGWLVPPADLDAWVAALAVLSDAAAVDAAGAACRARYEREHSEPVALQRLLDVYQQVLA